MYIYSVTSKSAVVNLSDDLAEFASAQVSSVEK